MIRQPFSLALSIMLCGTVSGVDHSEIIAKVRPEHVLAGIDVYRTHVQEAYSRLGKPDALKDERVEDVPEAVLRDYVWSYGSCILKTSGYVVKGEDTGLYFVSLEGCLAAPTSWKTSAGLALGMSIAQVKRLYGTRFSGGPHARDRTINYEFRDGTTLTIEFDSAHKVTAITLMANVE